jgi:mRNA interferase MazF
VVKQYVPDRGHIVHINWSPHVGREQGKRRPALVMTPSAYNGAVGLALLVPITTKVKGYIFEVPLPESLKTRGVILSDQIKSFDWRGRNVVFEEAAPPTLFDEVTARIGALLDLN